MPATPCFRAPDDCAANLDALPHTLHTEADLRALIGHPAYLTCAKISHRLNAMTRQFVERSPIVCIATSDAAGHCGLTPCASTAAPR